MNKIAILSGGESTEREVALRSATFIQQELSTRFTVDFFDLPRDAQMFASRCREYLVAIPVFHGKGGEDGTVQGFLETLKVPYLFSGVEAHAVGMNKLLTRQVAASVGLSPSPLTQKAPAVFKTVHGGSSIGTTIAKTQDEFKQILSVAAGFSLRSHPEGCGYQDEIMIEQYIEGKEFTVAVIDENKKPVALPVIQIITKKVFFDFEAKYDPALTDEICPAQIDEALAAALQDQAIRIHAALGARHITRSDFIVDATGKIWFLETNTIPGFTKDSLTPKALRASGRTIVDVFSAWIQEATS